jgi:putative ABC transport system substrate-binding protein
MRRRDFIFALAISPAPLCGSAVHAQQHSLPTVGFLHASSEKAFSNFAAAMREGLKEGGFKESDNVLIEYRWAENRYDRLEMLATELVSRKVAVIVAGGGTLGAKAAIAATATIPIVFVSGGDPVKDGLVSSLNRPSGNATGINQFASVLIAKRMELLREIVPGASRVGFLVNPDNPNADVEVRELQEAGAASGVRLLIRPAKIIHDVEAALRSFAEEGAGAMIVGTDAFFLSKRSEIVSSARQFSMPASYSVREYTDVGGLMSYGANRADLWRQAGVYASRILRGEKPGNLPILQPTMFELVINQKTAKELGLAIPPTLLARADEVIE